MHEAITYAQSRKGPALVHASVVRLHSHSLSDDQKAYRSEEECKADLEQDPLKLFKHWCIQESIASEADLKKIESAVDNDIAEATSQALKASQPNPATVLDYLYSPKIDPASTAFTSEPTPSGDPETMVTAINHTLRDEMTCNPHMVMFGQDIADCSRTESLPSVSGKGGVFKVTHGLQRAFGEDRVFNTPVAEAGIVGRALGMAIRGIKPVVEIQFFDYIWPAMMQLRNEISMLRYRSNNTYACPMVIRVPIGGYLRGGALYHSQSGESIFAHCPGLRIAYPSNAEDASGLLRTAIRCDDPVLFFEHKHLYRQTYNKHPYPGADYTIPFGQAAVRREGHDIVVVTWGALVQRSLLAAQQASKANISVMVLDLRTIAPYDWESIASAIQQTNRVVIAHEDQLTCGFGAELGSRIAEELFDCLDAPIKRVAALDCPVAYHPILEEQILPQTNDILKAIQEVASY
jgi:2-oxoisovalerate dehydrogenase E1 component